MPARMVMRPPARQREKALLYGPMAAGKTLNGLKIIAAALAAGETAYIIDCDNSIERFLPRFEGKLDVREEWELAPNPDSSSARMTGGLARTEEWTVEGGNVVLFHVASWEQFKWAIEQCWARAGRGDWVLVDSVTWPWQWVVDWYITKVHGAGLPDFLLQYRIDSLKDNKGDAGEGGAVLVEYKYINKLWSEVIAAPLVNARCHVLLTAEAKEVRTDGHGDKKDIKQLYGNVGMKPDTQRRVGFNVHTIVYLEKANTTKDEWFATTVKDRERDEVLRRVDVGAGLDRVWLKDCAGWTMTVERGGV